MHPESPCVFTKGITRIDLPIRHAQGKFVVHPDILARLQEGHQIVLRYAREDGRPAKGKFPWNPNGSVDDIAGICNPTGRIFGLMPHPEAFCSMTNHPDWTRMLWKAPVEEREALARGEGAGVKIFRNVVRSAEKALL